MAGAATVPVEPPSGGWRRRHVAFLLGTDEHIHRETRVGLVPRHLAELRRALTACGLEPELLVLAGAGGRAGFDDRAYTEAGARVIEEAELADLTLDVVHALKEPTAYESRLPGPFLRIGALHLASRPAGVCALVGRRNFAGIVDGGMVGGCAYLLDGGDRTPIVASMSRFAGSVAARKLVDGVRARGHSRGKVVVVGGGVAGTSAAETLTPIADELVIIERHPPLYGDLAMKLYELGVASFRVVPRITDEVLDGAIAVVFAHRSGALAAEKVCTLEQIRRMKPGAGIADIAIDQGGSILHDGYDERDDALTARAKYRELLDGPFFYYAEVNMPREEPHDASQVHGDAVLPYVTTLLMLVARHGSPEAVVGALLERPARTFDDAADVAGRSRFDCLVQDLRNGLQLAVVDDRVELLDPDLGRDRSLRRWLADCAGASPPETP
ncbi:MAG: hypothetical protein D6696_16125 [Acidobacteria bacterium]|nr:MAG: hypothetical protein D6696_16125 [Acidobacteriota bacterium]